MSKNKACGLTGVFNEGTFAVSYIQTEDKNKNTAVIEKTEQESRSK